jgi:hypothetical protein
MSCPKCKTELLELSLFFSQCICCGYINYFNRPDDQYSAMDGLSTVFEFSSNDYINSTSFHNDPFANLLYNRLHNINDREEEVFYIPNLTPDDTIS